MNVSVKVGILSDTHLSNPTEEFKSVLKKYFSEVDLIIHAGDMVSMSVYDYLSNWDIRAVRGNMDDFDLKALLPEKRVEIIEGKRIGIVHGRGGPTGIEHLVFREFADENIDVIIFGHSHVPIMTKIGETIIFNPGAYKASLFQNRTLGIMEIKGDIFLKHITL